MDVQIDRCPSSDTKRFACRRDDRIGARAECLSHVVQRGSQAGPRVDDIGIRPEEVGQPFPRMWTRIHRKVDEERKGFFGAKDYRSTIECRLGGTEELELNPAHATRSCPHPFHPSRLGMSSDDRIKEVLSLWR